MNNDVMKDPRTTGFVAFVTDMKAVMEKHGYTPRELHVSPNDEFFCSFATVAGVRVVKDYGIQNGKLYLT